MTRELKTKYFSIKSPPTVMEIIDDEAIMINGEKGTYYNLSPHATLILNSILNGYSLEEISSFNNLKSSTKIILFFFSPDSNSSINLSNIL